MNSHYSRGCNFSCRRYRLNDKISEGHKIKISKILLVDKIIVCLQNKHDMRVLVWFLL
jgi:hypothetical protein